jgi:hypothetical protein
MPRKPRIYYTETDKALMWDRWRKGDSLQTIAQLFDRSHGSVATIPAVIPPGVRGADSAKLQIQQAVPLTAGAPSRAI